MQPSEDAVAAMYRELQEETGLAPDDVELLGQTRRWLRYRLPARYMRRRSRPVCIGQKQRWFALRLRADESAIDVHHSQHPEFDDWCWVDYWYPPDAVIFFKRQVYRQALRELAPVVGAALGAHWTDAAADRG